MTSIFNIEIKESIDELKQLLSQQTSARYRDRIRALYLRQSGQVTSRHQLAEVLGCAESTLYRWFATYQCLGLSGLLKEKTSPGRPTTLTPQTLDCLRQHLSQPQGFSSYGEVQQWLQQQHQVQAAYSTVHGIVRYKLQSKLKAPRPRSLEADRQVQTTLKKNSLRSLR